MGAEVSGSVQHALSVLPVTSETAPCPLVQGTFVRADAHQVTLDVGPSRLSFDRADVVEVRATSVDNRDVLHRSVEVELTLAPRAALADARIPAGPARRPPFAVVTRQAEAVVMGSADYRRRERTYLLTHGLLDR